MNEGRVRGDDAPVQVLYVMGLGRSGSTVLDSVLGNHPRVVGLGELRNLPRAGWQRNEFCACGERALDCPFWSRVRERWGELAGGAEAAELWRLQAAVERSRNWLGLSADPPRPRDDFAAYGRRTVALLRAIRGTAGRPLLVDSSKLPPRALALSRLEGIDLRAVHLVRDGRGVAWSLRRSLPADPALGVARPIRGKPVLRTALRWVFVNHLAERVARRLGPERVRRVRYEDFATDPGQALAALGELQGVDFGELGRRAARGDELAIGHAVAGNRLRMKGSVRLRFDESWKEKLAPRDEALFRLVAGRTLRRYGYLS
jgi:hypothetical protein